MKRNDLEKLNEFFFLKFVQFRFWGYLLLMGCSLFPPKNILIYSLEFSFISHKLIDNKYVCFSHRIDSCFFLFLWISKRKENQPN